MIKYKNGKQIDLYLEISTIISLFNAKTYTYINFILVFTFCKYQYRNLIMKFSLLQQFKLISIVIISQFERKINQTK